MLQNLTSADLVQQSSFAGRTWPPRLVNGKFGTCVAVDLSADKFDVEMEEGLGRIAVRAEHLTDVPAGAPAAAQAAQPRVVQTSTPAASWQNHAPQAPTAPAVPSEWTIMTDPSSGRTYYYNASTGTSSWERPAQ
jgi:hypothetical protein